MHKLLSGLLATLLLPAALLAQPAEWLNDSGLHLQRAGEVRFVAQDGNQLRAFTYRSTAFNPALSPIWFVMHGTLRDAENYRNQAASVAERKAALVVAIEFPEHLYASYTTNQALFAEIEHVFDAVVSSLGGIQSGYYLFGHSAGAQFTHRLLTFNPEARVLGAVAANAGWYTLPNRADDLPYGLADSDLTDAEIAQLLAAPLAVLVGEEDTATPAEDPLLRDSPEAMAQGENRLERGEYYFNAGAAQAAAMATTLNWQFNVVANTDHSSTRMVGSSAVYLFDSGTACESDAATGDIIFTEILADPAPGMDGDANWDGIQDNSDDEYVRLTNVGHEPVCLSGWTLGDVSRTVRHTFPLMEALAPGESVVVFGGGLPTGYFDATVMDVPGDRILSLNNSGDVITLRDHADRVAAQVSWGSCAGSNCAANHIEGSLSIDRPVWFIAGVWQ